jgi:hypothetical protein
MIKDLRFRASGAAPLFAGEDGLTESQQKTYDDYRERALLSVTDEKKKLTDKMKAEYEKLHQIKTDFENGVVELSAGGKTYIESLVKQSVYQYKKTFGSKETEKGITVEDDAIDFLNSFFLLDHKKSTIRT